MTGYRPYSLPGLCSATNLWWAALFNGGEGWHNNHHALPLSATHGFRWFEIDWVYLGLLALAQAGLVSDLRLPTAEAIAAAPHIPTVNSYYTRYPSTC